MTVFEDFNWIATFSSSGFVDMCVDHVPSPVAAAKMKVENLYTGPMDSDLVDTMIECDPEVL